MFALGIILCGLSFNVAAEPAVVTGPKLRVGDELIYRGTIIEASEHVTSRFRKQHELEIHVLVLESRLGSIDCALMTKVTAKIDRVVAEATVAITGLQNDSRKPTVNMKLFRIDDRGRVSMLNVKPGPPPLMLAEENPSSPVSPLPINTLPEIELGMFLPLPTKPVTLGGQWETVEPQRPPMVWTARRESTWNGARCIHIDGIQQTDAWARPSDAVAGWQRAETLWVTQSTGLASRVQRKITRREGNKTVGWIELSYELQPMNRAVGPRFDDIQRDIEFALSCDQELETLLTTHRRSDSEFTTLQSKIERHFQSHPLGTAYSEALQAVSRRCEAAADGAVLTPTIFPKSQEDHTPNVAGRPAPDFLAASVHSSQQIRLLETPSVPRLLIFYKPTSPTTPETLAVAQALQNRFGQRYEIVAAAIGDTPPIAEAQRQQLKLTFPVVDGRAVRKRYGVQFYPQFFVIDPAGNVAWHQEGFGSETGYLLNQEMEKLK